MLLLPFFYFGMDLTALILILICIAIAQVILHPIPQAKAYVRDIFGIYQHLLLFKMSMDGNWSLMKNGVLSAQVRWPSSGARMHV